MLGLKDMLMGQGDGGQEEGVRDVGSRIIREIARALAAGEGKRAG
jgi:hypothetical protein